MEELGAHCFLLIVEHPAYFEDLGFKWLRVFLCLLTLSLTCEYYLCETFSFCNLLRELLENLFVLLMQICKELERYMRDVSRSMALMISDSLSQFLAVTLEALDCILKF
jgi:hypothetical protein